MTTLRAIENLCPAYRDQINRAGSGSDQENFSATASVIVEEFARAARDHFRTEFLADANGSGRIIQSRRVAEISSPRSRVPSALKRIARIARWLSS